MSNDNFDAAIDETCLVGRPELVVTTEEHEITNLAIDALAADSDDVYCRGNRLVTVRVEERKLRAPEFPKGTPHIVDLPRATLRERLARAAEWKQYNRKGQIVPAHPPEWCVSQVEARGQWPGIRQLEAITEVPVLRPDGSILSTPGYDDATGLLYLPNGEPPKIPINPTRETALAARDRLLDLVCDFPFETPEHRSAWFSALLSLFARFAFHGPVPLFLIDANIRGAGKSLLADMCAVLYTGREAPRMTSTSDDNEQRKRITSLLMASAQMVLIDNVVGKLGDQHLDALLTCTEWTDRVLGENLQITLPQRTTWFASGNNVQLAADTPRRTCHIRLNHPDERPELRGGFKYPNILQHIRDNRAVLVADVLSVLRGYFVAGCPVQELGPSWGSYEAWSSVVRNAVVWVGLPDPGKTREELIEASDTETSALSELLDAWYNMDRGEKGFTVSAMLRELSGSPERTDCQRIREALEELTSTPSGGMFRPKQVGQVLKRYVGRVVKGRALQIKNKSTNQGVLWVVTATTKVLHAA